jgi:hypothetical protein
MDIEAVREENRGAGSKVRRNGIVPHRWLCHVGNEDRDEVGAPDRIGNGKHVEAGSPRCIRGPAVGS